jgi:hypothetical protein
LFKNTSADYPKKEYKSGRKKVLLFSSILLDLWGRGRVEAPPRFLSAKAITGKDSTFSTEKRKIKKRQSEKRKYSVHMTVEG